MNPSLEVNIGALFCLDYTFLLLVAIKSVGKIVKTKFFSHIFYQTFVILA
jgi:hypothetical protein